jgi:beta-lactamase class D
MQRIILVLTLILVNINHASAENCFLAKEQNKILVSEGACDVRHSPRCSFNIALSLMAYNERILTDAIHPEFPFKTGYPDYVARWKQPHNPSLWMENSCIWYSQLLTKKLGIAKLQDYVTKFKYGSQDVSGDPGKNNSLTRSWMSGSSLTISAQEQTVFLQKILDQNLPVSKKAYANTQEIIFLEQLAPGWKLYGKTGTGNLPMPDGSFDEHREGGWFVGWLENGKRAIVFASYVEQAKQELPAGARAKEIAKQRLLQIIT